MLETYKTLIENQYEAAFRTLKYCLDRCPDDSWNLPVCNHVISQTFFHTLFFADMYLGLNPQAVEDQPFHRAHETVFRGYEEMENQAPTKRYERTFIESYFEHCRSKAKSAVQAFTTTTLAEPAGFYWIKGKAAEVHVYNLRHIQHHAAQLSLRLRLDHEVDIPWVKSGWHP
jgi:hypothetical protein